MIDLIKNPKKNTFITKGNNILDRNFIGFRSERYLYHYLNTQVLNKSKFINRSLNFYIMFLENPKKLLEILKKECPDTWKYVNRRKFYPGGKFYEEMSDL